MPSSPNTTDIPTAEQLIEGLHRRLKQASQNIVNHRLETGEYVHHGDRIVPRIARDEQLAIERSAAFEAEQVLTLTYGEQELVDLRTEKLPFRMRKRRPHFDNRKRPAAASVEAFIHPQAVHVIAAAPILRQDGAEGMLKDGQLYAYDSKSRELIPLQGNFSGQVRKRRPRSATATLRKDQKTSFPKAK